MTRVCMITLNHSPFDDRLFYREARSLLKDGYQVQVISAARKSNEKNIYPGFKIKYVESDTNYRLLKWMLTLSKLFLESIHTSSDVYHCHEPDTFLVAILIKIFTRKRIIYDVYEYYEDVIPLSHGLTKFFLIFMTVIFEPMFCRFADGIIVADAEIRKRYEKLNKKVCVLYNYPCLDIFGQECKEKLRKASYPGRCVVIYVGGMTEERGILDLIKAVLEVSKIHPSIKLILVGWFLTEEFRDKCADYIRSKGMGGMVDILGGVPHTEISHLISSADIGAVLLHPIPKFYKNIPTKQFEYMACGKPIVGSDLPPISGYVGEAKCGILVDPTDVDEVADAISYLIEHPEEANAMGQRGKRAVLDKYNWGNEERKLLRFYVTIMGPVRTCETS
jgi:glycosyltransferase involved in cell wall biosynthesis